LEISCEFIMLTQSDLHRNWHLTLSWPIAAGLLLGWQPAAAQKVGLGMSPMRMELRLAPGASYSGTLRLVNEGELVRVRTSVLDFHLDTEQNPQFEPSLSQEADYTCRNWLTVNPMEAEIDAKGEIPVRYTLRVPADAQPRSYYCAAGFTSQPTAADANSGMGIRTAVRVVAAFYVVVGNPVPEGHLSAISLERVPGSNDLRAVVVLENTGKMFYRPAGTLAVLDPGGAAIESFEFTPLPVLPERKQRFLFPLKQVAGGQPVTLRVRVDVGAGEIEEGTVVVQRAAAPQ
jgi:hypothetical protein